MEGSSMGQYRELELTVLSAQDLKNVKMTGGAMNPYCVGWIYPHAKVPGAVNNGGGTNPTWNSLIKLVVEENLLEQGSANLTVEIYNNGKFSKKFIGAASIPLSDIKSQYKTSSSDSKSMSYQVRKKSGNYQGVLNVAVRVGKVLSDTEAAAWAAPAMGVPQMRMGPGTSGPYGQGMDQRYYQQQYPGAAYGQAAPGYYQQAPVQQRQRRGGFGGAGLGLGTGLLGGMLLGSALDGGGGGGGCGGGGGGCGGGCGG